MTNGIGHYPFRMSWSPDSKKLAFYDETFRLYCVDIDAKKVQTVDEDPWGDMQDYSWSTDSKWIAYSKSGDNGNTSIYFYSLDEKKPRQVTSGLYSDFNPCFSPDGKYLYFASNRATPFQFNGFDYDIHYVYPSVVCAVTLKADTPSPLAPESDEVEVKEEKKEDGEKDADKKDEKKDDKKDDKKKDAKDEKKDDDKKDADKKEDLVIDFDGLEARVVGLPVGMGNFGGLYPGDKKIYYVDAPNNTIGSAADEDGGGGFDLKYFDLDKRESKTVIGGITNFTFSADGKKILYQAKQVYGIVDAAEGKKVGDDKIATDDLDMKVDPPAEWKQMFAEAWRLERDFFYVNNMHGVDWNKMRSRYGALLPYLTSRDDLNYIIGELISELNAGHAYVGGGDYPTLQPVGTGLLGCDFEADKASGRYRVAKVYDGRNWDAQFKGPLGQPGINVKAGDYILAINGVDLKYPADPLALLENRAGKQTVIKVSKTADGKDAREVTVEPVASDINIRYADWVESNRLKVLEASGGRIGYVHVPNTATEGLMEFAKLFYGQANLDGIVIDERWNSGGWMPSLFVDRLARKPSSYWALRHFKRLSPFPPSVPRGYQAMLINEWAGSGGDAFPYLFRQAGLGPLIGKRTWGGLVGMNRNIPLMDGGGVTMPGIGFTDLEGNYAVENVGVSPTSRWRTRPIHRQGRRSAAREGGPGSHGEDQGESAEDSADPEGSGQALIRGGAERNERERGRRPRSRFVSGISGGSIVRQAGLLVRHRRPENLLPFGIAPRSQLIVHREVFLRDRVRAVHDLQAVLRPDEVAEIPDRRARRIADDEPRGEMYRRRAVPFHFVDGVFDVSAGAPAACRESDDLHIPVFVDAEGAFFRRRSEAFAARARAVAVADDDADFHRVLHVAYFRYQTVHQS